MRDLPKPIKHRLRELARAAHEEELRRALEPVAESFERWRRGELGSGELSEIIHDFHQGPARELFTYYNSPYLETIVARAITVGILDRATIPGELLEFLSGPLQLYERENASS